MHFKETCKKMWRSLRLVTINRELLVFGVFLLVAVVFWFIQTFKEQATTVVKFRLEVVDVPKNIVITSHIPDTISVTVKGRGFDVIDYLSKADTRTLKVDFSSLEKDNGVIIIDNSVWHRILSDKLGRALSFSSINPSTLEIFYSSGSHKYVNVVFGGNVTVDNRHVFGGVSLQPTYVEVFAPTSILDTLTTVSTEQVRFDNLTDTLHQMVALAPPPGVKCVPDSVNATVCVDLFAKKTLTVPIFTVNTPENTVLRTFPLETQVSFRVSSALYNTIKESDFVVVVDYNDTRPDEHKCSLILRSQPTGVSDVKLTPRKVDYLIEESVE